MKSSNSFFVQVDQAEFKLRLDRCSDLDIRRKAYETVIYDRAGDILGLLHAASIDENGRCHPTEHSLRPIDPPHRQLHPPLVA